MIQKRQGKFINKLQYILNNENYQEIIRWDQSKTMIDIFSLEQMENVILPDFFRHNKYDSFVRQLNIYGFKKLKANSGIRFTHEALLQGKGLLEIVSNHQQKKQKKSQRSEQIAAQSQIQIMREAENQQKPKNSQKIQQNSEIKVKSLKTISSENEQYPSGQMEMNTQPMMNAPFLNYWNMLINNTNFYNGYYYMNPINYL